MNEIRFFGEYTFEKSPMVVMRGIEPIDLTRRQLETLSLLLDANGEVVSRDTFLDQVWGNVIVEEHNLTQTIFLLRKALGKLPNGQEYIETVPKSGYRMAPAALQPDLTQQSFSFPPHPSGEVAVVESSSTEETTPRLHGRRSFVKTAALILGSAMVAVMLGSGGRVLMDQPRLLRIRQITHDDQHKASEAPLFLYRNRLFFTETQEGHSLLASISLRDNTLSRRELPQSDAVLSALSPLADEALLFQTDDNGTITEASLRDDTFRPLSNFRGQSPVWSPDGKSIVFLRGRQIFVAEMSTQQPSLLATAEGIPFWPSWSPDGSRIRFSVHEPGGGQNIQAVDVATGHVSPVLRGEPLEHQACCGTWSSDGKYFTYVVGDGTSTSLWVRREGLWGFDIATSSWEVAAGPVDFWRSPTISPDRQHIYALGEHIRHKLVTLGPRFEEFLPQSSVASLNISHDGQWVAYSLYPEGSLWKSRVDGSEKTQLSGNNEYTRTPQWSSDDREIFYLRMEDGAPWSLARVDAHGAHRVMLANQGESDTTLSYDAVGERLAFDRTVAGNHKKISVFYLKTEQTEDIPGSEGMTCARWSPDGRYLSAVTVEGNQLRLFDTASQRWYTVPAAAAIGASVWSRKQNILYFTARVGQHYGLFKFQPPDRALAEAMPIPERYADGRSRQILEPNTNGELILGYSEGAIEIYDLHVNLPD